MATELGEFRRRRAFLRFAWNVGAFFVLLVGACGSTGTPPPIDSDLILFSAGGSVYSVSADGHDKPTRLIEGDRSSDALWASAPTADGEQLLFVRDLDIWQASIAGGDVQLLIDAGELISSPGASNFSLGAQSAYWSPDASQVLYTMGRISGSGLSAVWVAGGDGAELVHESSGFIAARWSSGGDVLLWDRSALRLSGPGFVAEAIVNDAPARAGVVLTEHDGALLIGPFIDDGPILVGPPNDLRQVAMGVAPAFSPDGRWIAYFSGDLIRIVRADGSEDHELIDLAPLGGRDQHHASGCTEPACSYRPPLVFWLP